MLIGMVQEIKIMVYVTYKPTSNDCLENNAKLTYKITQSYMSSWATFYDHERK